MDDKKKTRLVNAVFLLNGVLFLLGGIGLYQEHKPTLSILHFIAAFFNLSMSANKLGKKTRARNAYIIHSMNIAVAAFIALDFFLAGRNYIQYAWLLASLLSAVALVIHYRQTTPAR